MLFKLKEKLTAALGGFGTVLYFIISILVYVLPFIFIDCNFFLTALFIGIQSLVPFVDLIFWVWGLVCAITGKQDVWTIGYYIAFAAFVLPEIIYLIIALLSLVGNKKANR